MKQEARAESEAGTRVENEAGTRVESNAGAIAEGRGSAVLRLPMLIYPYVPNLSNGRAGFSGALPTTKNDLFQNRLPSLATTVHTEFQCRHDRANRAGSSNTDRARGGAPIRCGLVA